MPSSILQLLNLLCLIGLSSAVGQFCRSEACNLLSANLLLNINLTANPCDNFYEYSCGGFSRRVRYDINDDGVEAYTDAPKQMAAEMENRLHEVLIDTSLVELKSSEKSLQEALRLTKALYKNCVQWRAMKSTLKSELELQTSDAIRNVNPLLEHLFGTDTNFLRLSLEQLLARTAAMGLGTLFDLGMPEELNAVWSVNISSPEYTKAPKLMLEVSTFNFTADTSYWKPMLNFLMLNNVTTSRVIKSSSVFGAEPDCAIGSIASEVKSIVESMQNLTQPFNGSLEALELELKTSVPRFNFSLFLHELQPTGVDKRTIVEVDNLPMLTALLNYFVTDSASSNSYAEMRRIKRLVFLTLDALLEFTDLLPPTGPSLKPRQNSVALKERQAGGRCLEITQQLMEPALVWLYRRRFHPEKLNSVDKVIEATKSAFVYKIVHQDWITEADKAKMVEKVSDMRYFVGHQEFTDKQLASFYGNVLLNASKNMANFGYTLGLAMKASAKRHLDLLTENPPMKPSIFNVDQPFTVNAYYGIYGNSLTFPLAILTPPLYAPGYPDFATYGAFAALVGHEIGHGFAEQWVNNASSEQSTFMQLDAETQANYQRLVECMRTEFAIILNRTSYWNETLAEDIADNMGISAAYRAYVVERSVENDLLPGVLFDPIYFGQAPRRNSPERFDSNWQRQQLERLFFVMAAQPYCTKASQEGMEDAFGSGGHSSGPVRVNAMMRSSKDFARVFQCPSGSPMNPLKKCVFW